MNRAAYEPHRDPEPIVAWERSCRVSVSFRLQISYHLNDYLWLYLPCYL